MTTLREAVAARENDYSALADAYAAAVGADLVDDPFRSYQHGPSRLTRSASVLIGAHDSVTSLVPALVSIEQSAFNARHPELLEVIVVDDGSSDGTRERLLGLELDLDWRYVRQERAGLTHAHNTALGFARGDVVVFSDADVLHTPYALEELMKRHEVLDHVTLCGFRFDVMPEDPRLDPARLPQALRELVPAFWRDFRLSFGGWPSNLCRDTDHFRAFGAGRHVTLAHGGAYDLAGMVVGALMSIERADLLRMGGSDERLVGWGCEDSLIGARSLAFGNAVIPVYSAAAWHVWHPRRDPAERSEFAANLRALARIYEQQAGERPADPERWRARALETWASPRVEREVLKPPQDYPPRSETAWAEAAEATGRFREARDRYEALDGHPGLARCLLELDEPDAAAAAALDPFTRARALAALHRHRDARDELAQLASPPWEVSWLLSASAEQHKRRGNAHARQGLHRLAITDFELASIVDPDAPWPHFDRACSLRELGRDEAALASATRVDALLHPDDGNRTWIHSTLAELLVRRGAHEAAHAELQRALELHPRNDQALALAAELAASRT
jgi:tetratricopeptide (TPR) repeat protein